MSKHLLDEANKKYKDLYDTRKDRFKNLPYYHRSKSNWFEKENNNEINPFYTRYKRGTIIYVEFGVNIGHELSGGHFAIVLNDDDNKRNSILNVIPLSSKNKKFYLPIDKTVFNNASSHLKQRFDDFSDRYKDAENQINSFVKDLKELEEELNEKTKDDNLSKENADFFKPKIEEMKNRVNQLVKKAQDNEEAKNQIEDAYLRYSKFDKHTYACYQSIQTISKLKIRRINKYDPSGRMKVDNATLDKIDKKIVEYYTNFSIDEK